MKKITFFTILLIGSYSFSQIINTAPYILTVDQLKEWTPSGTTASPGLISTVPLAPRFVNTATQFNPALSNDMKIAYLPDGMNNFGNYLGEQNQFNLFNFTHWQYIDKLVWFGGTSSQAIQIPSSPWANAAHKNGVKIFGNVFFAPTAFGGATATLTDFLEQDGNGDFVAIPKMIAIMQYYNFDGWFINQETATNTATAQLMYAFVRDLTAQAEAVGKEIMWYDAMVLNGSVGWQNRLNTNNSVFVQRDEDGDTSNGFETRVSSSIFINFAWSGNIVTNASRTRAIAIGRSQFDVFTGVDIWPGRNQGDFESGGNTFMSSLHESNGTTAVTSLGIFAPNCVYNNSTYTHFNNDPADYASFYNAENHMFSGDDNNPGIADVTGYKGFCNWIPEASVISTMPFYTDFGTGHGTKKFNLGSQTSADSWHDMNQQDILPTWQFAFSPNGLLTAEWDFEDAVMKGNSLKISGHLPANTPIDLMLYKTKLMASPGRSFEFGMFIKSQTNFINLKAIVVYADEPDQKYELVPLFGQSANNGWNYYHMTGVMPNREVAMIGLRFHSSDDLTNYSVNIGEILLQNGPPLAITENFKDNGSVTVSYPLGSESQIRFDINWPNTSQINYMLYDLQGRIIKGDVIYFSGITNYALNTNGLDKGTYLIKFSDENNRSETKKIVVR